MNIDLEQAKSALKALLNANMDGDADGGHIFVDGDGALSAEESAPGKKSWKHTLFEVKISDDEFHLLVNPKLKFCQEIDLMDEDLPDTVDEVVDMLWEDILCGIEEYTDCFK